MELGGLGWRGEGDNVDGRGGGAREGRVDSTKIGRREGGKKRKRTINDVEVLQSEE